MRVLPNSSIGFGPIRFLVPENETGRERARTCVRCERERICVCERENVDGRKKKRKKRKKRRMRE